MKKHRIRFSFQFRIAVMVIFLSLVIVVVSMAYFSLTTSSNNFNNYSKLANNLSATIAETVDKDDFVKLKKTVLDVYNDSKTHPFNVDENATEEEIKAHNDYISQYEFVLTDETFLRLRDYLRSIVRANESSEVDCAYLSYLVPETEQIIYLVDSAEESEACLPGTLDPILEINSEVITNPARGFPAYTSDILGYGYLITAGSPIYYNNEVVGFACTDILMATVRQTQANAIMTLFWYLISTVAGIALITLVLVYFIFVRPVKQLQGLSNAYDANDVEKTHKVFSQFELKTKDELQDLGMSLKKIENDAYQSITTLQKTNEELILAQEETKKITEIANRDALTSCYSKMAYYNIIDRINGYIKNKENKPFGIAMIDLNDLKIVNDKFGHDMGDNVLIELTKLIQSIFVTSKTYRVGGDEFAVIIIDEEYEKAKDLVDEFRDQISARMQNQELTVPYKISAAIGYSAFDPYTDSTVDDVFRRADKIMYIQKHMMKTHQDSSIHSE